MSVYKEGYSILKDIETYSQGIFSDACDFGAPVYKEKVPSGRNGILFSDLKQLVDWYGEDTTFEEIRESTIKRTKDSCSSKVMLMDEWAVSDKRKTEEEATEWFKVEYFSLLNWKNKPYLRSDLKDADGYVTIIKIN